MTLTVVVGSEPGSGKTALLNDIYKRQDCIYIRQNYSMRSYVKVSEIRHFDPTELPYWQVYEKAGTEAKIKVGGTMARGRCAGEGLSEGQRKLLYLEILCQRTEGLTGLLILLDEPLAGMTDDFVPYFLDSLNDMRHRHNIIVASSLRVEDLKQIASNVITVSAIDHTVVRLNSTDEIDRNKVISALAAVGKNYDHASVQDDVRFFIDVEILSNNGLLGVAIFSFCCFSMFMAALWDSDQSNAPLVFVAGGLISHASVYHYLLSFVEWRNVMQEEVEALVHSSKQMNKTLKTLLAVFIITIISMMQFCVVSAVMDGISSVKFWIAMLFDSISLTAPFICLGLFTSMSAQAVRILGSLPFVMMILFSSTFSPGSGVTGLKELRYIFPRFYFWCMIPSIQDSMEGCPQEDYQIMLCLILCAFLGLSLFLVPMALVDIRKHWIIKNDAIRNATTSTKDREFIWLQTELYGDKATRYFPPQKEQKAKTNNNNNNNNNNDLSRCYLPQQQQQQQQVAVSRIEAAAATDAGLQESQHSRITNNSNNYSEHSFRVAV